jgi:hypothetical protein
MSSSFFGSIKGRFSDATFIAPEMQVIINDITIATTIFIGAIFILAYCVINVVMVAFPRCYALKY